MRKFSWLFTFIFLFSFSGSIGQKPTDTSSLLYAFKSGKMSGHFRSFFMTTINDGPLSDYYALAFGGGLKYQTQSYKGFQLGIGGFYIWNLSSSDLTRPDSLTNITNRYEIGQFDQTNPINKKDLQRLEDFYIRYSFKKSSVTFGKQVIKTPFINQQDGRMRPTGEQGFWAQINELKSIRIDLGWLTHISPRGTLKWYTGASSIGIYPSGVTISGEKSDYRTNVRSKGIAVAGVTYSLNSHVKLQAWDHWVENIFNIIFVQTDAQFPVDKDTRVTIAVNYIHQNAIKNGGNKDQMKTYFDPSQKVNIIGFSAGYRKKNSTAGINYSRITKDGRFLFPREWGREPLFTFLTRERNEGLGDVNAYTVNFRHNLLKEKLIFELGTGYYDLPDVKNYRLNKYGMPSYYQFNFDSRYSFDGLLNGLNLELLYLYKASKGNVYNEWKYVINKVNMHQLNFILNYNF